MAFLLGGKFEQVNQNIPFLAFVQSFRGLALQLLGQSDSALAALKQEILEAVGGQGQVLINVLPELEHLIGKQPSVPELSGVSAQNRFDRLCKYRWYPRSFPFGNAAEI